MIIFRASTTYTKIHRMKFKKYMPTLGLEPNTCSLHEHYHSTLAPGLVVNTSNFYKYRRHFADSEQSITLIQVFLQISRGIDVFA
jgi:hypothetical protein